MIGRTLGPYEVLSLIGKGGMGEVYRARDTRLDREVALKIVPADVSADPTRLERFEREARTLAALNHPHIVTLHSVEEEDGVRFLTMELVEGQGLDERIPEGGFPLDEWLAVAIAVSEALAAAHERGIVHRDLKPANVMLTADGRAKVLDFGLAKAVEEISPGEDDATRALDLTREGSTLGTVPYMSPEQLRGSPVDARSDLFSLGILLHEMATGTRPFTGPSAADFTAAILERTPARVGDTRPDLPADLDRIVARCLEKDPANRYATGAAARDELLALRRSLNSGVVSSVGSAPAGPARSGSRLPWLVGLVAIVAAVAGILALRPGPEAGDSPSVLAVLPFEDLSPTEENELFAVGVHEDVMATLSGLGDLRVISRTSVRRLRVDEMTLPEIGKRLGAEYVLEGSVRRAGNQVRVTTQLFEAATDRSLWSATYDREMTDLLALQADLAREIAGTLQAHLSPREEERLASPRKVVVEAYDDYVRARELLHGFWVGYGDLEEAATLLDDAVAADPGFVEGWALLSRARADLADRMREMDDREVESNAAAEAARTGLERARALDPEAVATLKAEAFYHEEVEGDPVAALRYLDRAEEIAPSDSDALFLQAVLAMRLGQLDRAISIMERTFRLDSGNLFYGFALTYAYDMAGRYGDAVPFLERLLELEPERTHYAVRAAYFHFLDEGSLEAYRAFEKTIRTIPRPDACDTRSVQNHEMIVALLDDDFEGYASRWQGKWEAHHRGHGNWACPAQINEETNHARLLLEHGRTAAADSVLTLARNSTARPYTEDSVCIFDRAAFLPKLAWLAGDEEDAREELEEALPRILANDLVPRGPVERAVLLETADLVVPDRVYSIYRQIQEHPLPGITLETVCANPWLFPNLLRDPRFVAEVREDGRFVGFLESFGVLSPIG